MTDIISQLDNVDYQYELETGRLIDYNKKLLFIFGEEILECLNSLEIFESHLYSSFGEILMPKKAMLEKSQDCEVDCRLVLENEVVDIKDVFWIDPIEKSIKGYLFLKTERRKYTLKSNSILEFVENIPNHFLIFDQNLESVYVANRMVLEGVPFPFSQLTQGFQLKNFFKKESHFNQVVAWLNSPKRDFLITTQLFLSGGLTPKWFKVKLTRILYDLKPAITAHLIDVDDLKNKESELLLKNTISQGLIELQNSFFISRDNGSQLQNLLGFIKQLTNSEFGFLGRVIEIKGSKILQLDAFSDFSNSSNEFDQVDSNLSASNIIFEYFKDVIETCISDKRVVCFNNDFDLVGQKFKRTYPNIKNFCIIPIVDEDEVLGMIGLSNYEPDEYAEIIYLLEPVFSFYMLVIKAQQEKKEKEKLEKTKLEQEIIFKNVFKQATDILVILDKSEKVLYSSYSAESLVKNARTVKSLVKELTKKKNQRSTTSFKRLVKIPKANGADSWLDITLNLIFDWDGQLDKYFIIAQDATKRIKNEVLLKQALQKERDVNLFRKNFISVVSHEFKTPLTIIKSTADIVKIYLRKSENEFLQKTVSTKLEKIETQVDSVNLLISKVLDLEKLDNNLINNSLEWVQVMSFVVFLKEKFKGELLEIDSSDISDNVFVLVDDILFRHALVNIIENAKKYSFGDRVDVRFLLNQSMFIVEIQDYGIGIPKEDHVDIFKPFFRASNSSSIDGTGLGLALVKKFIEIMHADIQIESELEKGTIMKIIFYNLKCNQNVE